MDSGHGQQTLSGSDFQSTTILSTETSTMLSQQDSSRSVSICDGLPTYVKELIAGGAAGGITKTIVAPLERVKILYQDSMAFEEHVHPVGSFSPFKSAPIERIKDAALVD